jgi:hypothetical protein
MNIPKPALAGAGDIPFWPQLTESGFRSPAGVNQAITATVKNPKNDRTPQFTVTEVNDDKCA